MKCVADAAETVERTKECVTDWSIEPDVRHTVRKDVLRHLLRHAQGQSMVEFSLTILVTLLITFGMVEFSRVIYTVSILQWAAQAGARAAIVDPDNIDPAAVADAVRDRMTGLDTDALVVNPLVVSPTNEITVSLRYTFDFITPMISAFSGGDIELTASASMVAF